MASVDANDTVYIDLSRTFTRTGLGFFLFLLYGADQKTAILFYGCCKT